MLLSIVNLAAEIKLAGMFSDNMVLQRGKPIIIWGWAAPRERVDISFAGEKNIRKLTQRATGRLS